MNHVILMLIATLLTYLIKLELGPSATPFQLTRASHNQRFDVAELWLKPFIPT
ncbi:hypothetical protein [Vagococcus allomyrinae]|uniref:hypothetical protein n=1 Tax=Vagococcus allomyrinae TaxID=2794353 RepID=UPI001FD7D4E9|nr:hypothetical protein [Vagococcus allomyrinae]